MVLGTVVILEKLDASGCVASCGDCIHRGWSVTGWQEPAHSGAPDVARLMSVTWSVLQGPRATVVPDGLHICRFWHCTRWSRWSGSGGQGQVEADESVLWPPKAHTLQQNLLQSVNSAAAWRQEEAANPESAEAQSGLWPNPLQTARWQDSVL